MNLTLTTIHFGTHEHLIIDERCVQLDPTSQSFGRRRGFLHVIGTHINNCVGRKQIVFVQVLAEQRC